MHLASIVVLCLSLLMTSTHATVSQKLDIISSTDIGSISGQATIRSQGKNRFSKVTILLDRFSDEINDALDNGDQLEAWIADHGTATDSSASSANTADDNNAPYTDLLDQAPFFTSLGKFKKTKKGNYRIDYTIRNPLIPYDFLMISLEAGGNRSNYDPRPGTELYRVDLDLN